MTASGKRHTWLCVFCPTANVMDYSPSIGQTARPRLVVQSSVFPSTINSALVSQCLALWPCSRLSRKPSSPRFDRKPPPPPGRRPVTDTGFRLQSLAEVPRRPVLRPFSLTFLEPITPRFNRKPSSLREDGHSPAQISSCSPQPRFRGVWFSGFTPWLSPEPTTP